MSRDSLIAGFQESNPDAGTDQAGCVVDRLLERYGIEELEELLQTEPIADDFEEAQFRDMFACGIEGDVQAQIVDQLVANGVEAADAPCVAEGLMTDLDDDDIDVLLSGEITDEFYQKFFVAMESCDAIG